MIKRGDDTMPPKRNFQLELDHLIEHLIHEHNRPKLFLHSCCAPCSSYVLEYLSRFFDITLFYYNPNISPRTEFDKRISELRRLVSQMLPDSGIQIIEGKYDPETFFALAQGLENEPERGKRCMLCYRLRLEESAKQAKALGMDYFTTTLSISPMKNAEALNAIGEALAKEYGIPYLVSDFKKKNGYKRSIELSKEYDLYRQNYCGCIYSKQVCKNSQKIY